MMPAASSERVNSFFGTGFACRFCQLRCMTTDKAVRHVGVVFDYCEEWLLVGLLLDFGGCRRRVLRSIVR